MDKLKEIIRKEISRVLNEIGTGKSYNFKQVRFRKKVVPGNTNISYKPDEDTYKGLVAEYEFETETGTEYQVTFENLGSRKENLEHVIKVDFKSMDHTQYSGRPEPLTGEGDAIKIIETVIDCAKDLYREYSEVIEGFAFSGGLKSKNKESIKSQRAQIYKKILKRRFPKADISTIETKWSKKKFIYVPIN